MMITVIPFILNEHARLSIDIIINAILNVTMNLETATSAVAAIISGYRMALTILFCGHVKPSLKHIFYDYFSIRIILPYAFHSFFCVCHNKSTALIRIHDVCAVILVSGHLPSTKVVENKIVEDDQVEATTQKIAMAALKYGDLSNQPTKDYNFDMERFAAFEGNTGPYILYTIVRIKSILSRYGAWEQLPIQAPANDYAKELMISVTKLGPTLENALRTSSPNLICAYIYELAGCVNKFYHETRILTEEDEARKAGYVALIGLAKNILEQCIYLLGFSAPEKM